MVAAFRAALPFTVAFLVSLALAISACAARMAVELLPAAVLEGDCRVGRDAGHALPIVWFRPRDPGQAAALDAWCRSVGPPAILRGTPADDVVFDRLVIASWNTHVGGGRLDRFIGDLRAGKLTGGERVVHFVLLLQEVFRADAALPPVPRGVDAPDFIGGGIERQAVIDVARRHQLSLYYVPSMRNGAAAQAGRLPEDRGNSIVSTLPLDEYAAVELPFAAQRRVAALASLRMRTSSGLRRIRLISTHLDASLGWRRLWVVGAANHAPRRRPRSSRPSTTTSPRVRTRRSSAATSIRSMAPQNVPTTSCWPPFRNRRIPVRSSPSRRGGGGSIFCSCGCRLSGARATASSTRIATARITGRSSAGSSSSATRREGGRSLALIADGRNAPQYGGAWVTQSPEAINGRLQTR